MKKVFLLVAVLLLSACGAHNPLIGKWQGDTPAGIGATMAALMGPNIIEFTRSAYISTGNVETKLDSYDIQKDKVGMIVSSDNQKVTVWFTLVDENTISEDLGSIKLVFHRMKS